LSALANRISLTLLWVEATPFTRPPSDEPDLKTSSLDVELYAECELRTVPAKAAIELSLGDTESKRLCPAFTNSSPSPLEKNGGRRSRCTAISGQKKRSEVSHDHKEYAYCSPLTKSISFARRWKAQQATWIELGRVISADHFCSGLTGPTITWHPYLGQQMSIGPTAGKLTSNYRQSV
jgi:hypothetical protein